MKHVRALPCEPPLLAKYRASHPAEVQRPETEASATWEDFKADRPAYQELLAKLAEAQQGLCIYCEQRLVDGDGKLVPHDYQVEHVQAKSGAVGRVLDWQNLALACGGATYRDHLDETRCYTGKQGTSCGQTKGEHDLPQGCDPRSFPLMHPFVEVAPLNGEISVSAQRCANAGVAQVDVEEAIKILNLNCERLRKARQDVADNTRRWFVSMLQELLSLQLTTTQQQATVDRFVSLRLQPDVQNALRRFWSSERSAIGPSAESWLMVNQKQFT